jgi:hypothetical protein
MLTFISAFLMKSQELVENNYEAVGMGTVLVAATVLIIALFLAWAWYSFHDLSTSSGGMAARAFTNSIGSSGSNVSGSGGGVEMGERRGSKFQTDNPLRPGMDVVENKDFDRSLSKEATGLRVGVVSKHEKRTAKGTFKRLESGGFNAFMGKGKGKKTGKKEGKKEGKSLFKRFEDELLRRSYERQYAKKPPNPNVKRDQQYEDPTPRPPPESQRKSPASKIETGDDGLLHVKKTDRI